MDDQAREDFRSYVVARSPALLRTAYLLTGSRADAEDLLQTALAKTCLSRDRIREREALDGYVRRVMVNTQTSWWRRRKVDEHPTDDLPSRSAAATTPPTSTCTTRCGRRSPICRASSGRRSSCASTRTSEAETARVLGVSPGTVKSTTSRALARLRANAELLTGLSDDPRTSLPTGARP